MSLRVRSGFVSGAERGDESRRQWALAVGATVAAGTVYVAGGVDLALDAYVLPEHLPMWSPLLGGSHALVVLLPDVQIAIRRNQIRRKATGWGVPEWQVRENHEAMSAWLNESDALIIDNSSTPLPEVVSAIDAFSFPARS